MTKILIVDDIIENLYMLEILLRGHGYEVKSASDGVEALGKLLQEDFDMVISDILMPRMDGFQLCREVKTNDKLKKIAFVFYTGTYIDPKDEEFALSLGAERFIVKPTEPDVFIEILKDIIKNHEMQLLGAPKTLIEKEDVYMKLYNERLINKLEDKMLELEKVNKGLKESEEKYRELIENANDAVIIIEPGGYLRFANPSFYKITGYSMEDAKNLLFINLIHPDDLPIIAENIEKALAGKEIPMRREVRFLTKSKEVIYGDYNPSVIKREERVVGILGIIRDITQRKQMEEKLKQSLEAIRRALEGTVRALAATAERRDPYTAGHQQRVTQLACTIAIEMELPREQIEGIRVAGILHDLGKIYVPAEILNKPGRLTDVEMELIKTHPRVGHDILKTIEFPWPVAEIVLQHHERINGSGYPSGLSGNEILLEARILAVADVIEAMSSHRPYRPALGIDKALDQISQGKAIIYDSNVVNACLRLFREKGFKFK